MSGNNLNLNFKDTSSDLKVVVLPHPKFQTDMHLGLSLENIEEFKNAISQLIQNLSLEIRIQLPLQPFGNYILYFKSSEKQNRLHIARPEISKWIGSLILSSDSLLMVEKACEDLKNVKINEFRFSSCGNLNSMCNFDIRLYRL